MVADAFAAGAAGAPPVAGIKITKATYGVPGDPARTRDVTQKLQAIVDGGETKIRVPQVAKGVDPAFRVVKTLTVEYVVAGETLTFRGKDKDFFTPQGAECREVSRRETCGGNHR